jgi:hypothetical protein
MTEEEATSILEGLRKAVKALDQTKAVQAFNASLNSDGIVTTNFNRGIDFGGALNTLERVRDEIDRKFLSN